MAIGGFGAALAGLGEAFQKAQQDKQRQQYLELEQRAFAERLRDSQETGAAQDYLGGLLPKITGSNLAGLANVGGAPSMSPAPSGQPTSLMPSGMRGGGDNWETQHNNFAGLRIPGSTVGPKAGGFQSFDTPEQGIGAISKQLDRYASGATTGKPLTTLRSMVSTWAPPSENKTDQLIQRASQVTGFPPDQPLNVSDPKVKAKLIDAFIRNEQGGRNPVSSSLIEKVTGEQMPPEEHDQASKLARGVAPSIPPMAFGGMTQEALAKLLQNSDPSVPPRVKWRAFEMLSKALAPSEQREWQWLMLQQRQTEARDIEGKRETFRATENDKTRTASAERQRVGIEAKNDPNAKLPPEAVSTMADQYLAGDRTVMQNLGRGAQGSANIVALRGEIAKKMAERGMSGQDMATKMAEFEGLKAGERVLSGRTANIGMRINEAKYFAPLAIAASQNVDRTQFPSFNKLYEAGLIGTGDESIVRFAGATQSFLNAYAAAVTPTGTPTEGAQSRAHELLDRAWSQGQYKAAIDQLMLEMEAASKSPGAVREEFRKGADPGLGANQPPGPVIKLDADGNPVQ